jgi:hypothetical protein
MTNGGVMREVVPKAELDKIARMSRSPARKEWAHQMHRKAAIRRIMGKMPREPAISQLLAHDDLSYDLPQGPAPRVTSGVRARLEAQASETTRPGFAPGTVDAALNPLTPESLDEVLGGDGVPSFADAEVEVESPVEADPIKSGVEGFLQGDNDFPGDRPAPPFDAYAWTDAMRRTVADAPTVNDLDSITAHPTFASNMERLREASLGGSKALEAAINGRRKALADKERVS